MAVTLGLLATNPPAARADNVIADDQIVQGNLCVGTPSINGEEFQSGGHVILKGTAPHIFFVDTNSTAIWSILAQSSDFAISQVPNSTKTPFRIATPAPTDSIRIAGDGKVGVGTGTPAQQLHVLKSQNANTFALVQNAVNGLAAAAVVRTQADIAMQNFQSHASSRTLVRWAVPLGGWNEFLSVVGTGLAMGPSATLRSSWVLPARRA
jgi:hypothetical protein